MKRTPRYGCSDTILVPPISNSPILEIHAKYLSESDWRTIQYSTPFLTYTGESNLNVVGTVASLDKLTLEKFLPETVLAATCPTVITVSLVIEVIALLFAWVSYPAWPIVPTELFPAPSIVTWSPTRSSVNFVLVPVTVVEPLVIATVPSSNGR